MAVLDLTKLEPTIVSRNMNNYKFFVYGLKKIGKTTLGVDFPNSLVLGFEEGYDKITGSMGVPMLNWNDYRTYIFTQLNKKSVKERFKTIVIDTADKAWKACKDYICEINSTKDKTYQDIQEIPHGKGWDKARMEFMNMLTMISYNYGYGIVLISHSKVQTLKVKIGGQDVEYSKYIPTLQDTIYQEINAFVDVALFANNDVNESGISEPTAFFRGDGMFEAGSRLHYLQNKCPLTYKDIEKAVADAIEKEEAVKGISYTDEDMRNKNRIKEDQISQEMFDGYKTKINEIVIMLNQKYANNSQFPFNNYWMPLVNNIIASELGSGNKISATGFEQRMEVYNIFDSLSALVSGI